MKICLIVLLFFSSLIGWLSIKIFVSLLWMKILPAKQADIRLALIQKFNESGFGDQLLNKVGQMDLETEFAPLVDQRLQHLIDQLKHDIPMGEILLSGSLAQRVKERARQEILKTLPEIKERMLLKVQAEFNVQEMVADYIGQFDAHQCRTFLHQEIKGDITKLEGIGALIGLILGAVEGLLFVWLC